MKIKSFIIILIIAVALAAGAVFYFWGNNWFGARKIKNLEPVVMGYNLWPGSLPYLMAYEKGFFKNQGLEVKLMEEESYGKMFDDLVNGKNDFSPSIALIDVMQNAAVGGNLRVVGVTDYSVGADGIVANSGINSVKDLKGKKVGVEKDTLGEFLLYKALQLNGLKFSDITEINLTAQAGTQALIRGELDAAVTYEPDLSQAKNEISGNIIFDSADIEGLITDTLVFSQDFIDSHPQRVKAILKAYFQAVEYIKNNPDEAYAIGAKYFKITPQKFKDSLNGVRIVDQRNNFSAFSHSSALTSLYVNGKAKNEFLFQLGKIKEPVDLEKIINGDFVREINQE